VEGEKDIAISLAHRVIALGNSTRLPDGYHLLALAKASSQGTPTPTAL
jgi:hypothetical protein